MVNCHAVRNSDWHVALSVPAETMTRRNRLVVTSKSLPQRWLHTFVGILRGRRNTHQTQKGDGAFADKIDYKSQETCEKSARKLAEKFGRPFDAYQCGFCGGWHIGNAANLTFRKFWSILWVFVIQKKRRIRKARLKPWNWEKPMDCERCGKPTSITILSMFNAQAICMGCKQAEEQRPDYKEAVAADEAAIRSGNFNFKGIGLK